MKRLAGRVNWSGSITADSCSDQELEQARRELRRRFDRELRERRDRFIAATREELHAKLEAERAELRRLRRRRKQYETP